MFRCKKCNQVIDGSPHRVPIGFKRDADGKATGDRIGEADLCSRCAERYEKALKDVVETRQGYMYKFLRSKNGTQKSST